MPYLQIIAGPQAGVVVELPPGYTISIGRGDDADFRLFDERASRKHCEVRAEDGQVVAVDLGAKNGTFLDSERLDAKKPTPIPAGSALSIGSTVFRCVMEGIAQAETVAVTRGVRVHSSISAAEVRRLSSVQEKSERLSLLFKFQSSLTPDPDLETCLRQTLESLIRLIPASVCQVRVWQTPIERVRKNIPPWLRARWPRDIQAAELPEHLVGRVRDQGEALLLTDLGPTTDGREIGTALVIPLQAGQRGRGFLYLDRSIGDGQKHSPFKAEDLTFGAQVADVVGRHLAGAIRLRESASLVSQSLQGEFTIIGTAPALESCYKNAAKVAPTDVTVLITGETGTGKELFARLIHRQGPHPDGPFVALNCAAIPADLLEAEIFGHEEGAFTGATAARQGKLELAAGGTLFLDEIGEFPLSLQPKLLRVLQDGRFYRVGGQKEIKVRFRLLSATNRDLDAMVSEGRFREDLLYRMRVFTIALPPLRDRRPDIPDLAQHFRQRCALRLSRKVDRISEPALKLLDAYHWPGNIRELENVIERAVVLTEGPEILPEHLPPHLSADRPTTPSDSPGLPGNWLEAGFPTPISLVDAERLAIITALKHTGGKKGETTKLLGCSWPTLNKKLRDYNINLETLRDDG